MTSRIQLLGLAAVLVLGMSACGGGKGHGDSPAADQLAAAGSSVSPDTAMPDVSRPVPDTDSDVDKDEDEMQESRSFVLTDINDEAVDVPGVEHHSIRPLNTATLYGYDWVQRDNAGNIVRLGQFVVDSDTVTRDLHGDAYFTMGRWEHGLERDLSELETDVDKRRYQNAPTDNTHFLLYKPVASFPANASLVCDGGVFTAPTLNPGFDGTRVLALPTGSATLQFSDSGANVGVQINVVRDSGPVSMQQTGYIPREWREQMVTPDDFGAPGANMNLALAEGGNGTFLVLGTYTTPMENYRDYHGLVTFRCR